MLSSVYIDGIMLSMLYGRRAKQSRSYPFNKFQTGETDIAEYSVPRNAIEFGSWSSWYPKRILANLIPHLVELMEDSVKVTCIYSFGLYQDSGSQCESYQSLTKYLEVIFKYEDPPGTAERLITEAIEEMPDLPCHYRIEEGEIILCVFKTEMYFKDDGYIRRFDLNIYKEDDCIICMENKSNILFCNCGHLIICESCYHKYQEDKCPKCRKENGNIKKKKKKIKF